MQNLFNDLEGLRIAIEIENRGKAFYCQAYEQATQQAHKDLFLLLMNEEIHHEKAFTDIFNKLKENKEAHSEDYLFDPEVSRYLTVLSEHHVFPAASAAKEKIAEFKSVADILQTALQAEKDSILFYDELARNSRFDDAKKVFQILKAEEQEHVVKIREMINAWA
jgi:rubrerythrin